jgi:Periplasmic glucans biosynthesis protein
MTTPPKRFTFADVRRRAAMLAGQPFEQNRQSIPEVLRNLRYDQHRDIRFKAEKAFWRDEGLPFEIQFFHLGSYFLTPVAVNIVDNGEVSAVAYQADFFDYGNTKFTEALPSDLGFAGFRLHYPLHQDNYYDEIAVFLGASYFRALGQHQHYGISARGLAIDTGLAKPEEFPYFREFWIEKPGRDATDITIYALLNSQSTTGAYRFVIRPGMETVIDTKISVFIRNRVDKLGIAPLTSMFFRGELTTRPVDEFRPEVHDSDGLLLALGSGEWIWRPLDNPRKLRISSYHDSNPRGFGLLQRDRMFDHYQDLEAAFHKRPSAWVEPVGAWGDGVIQIIEIPSDAEKYDNIVALWIPDKPTEAGQEWIFEYRLHSYLKHTGRPPGGWTVSTRTGAGGPEGVDRDRRRFVLDFARASNESLKIEAPVETVVTASSGRIANPVVQENKYTGGWRVSFELIPEGGAPIELRCFLKSGEHVLTETWSYQWSPE